ncbi:MAG TPA: hypothetical protein VGH49_18605 [Xanthobacteraceae bacterium]
MRFSWHGLFLAPLLVPVLFSATMVVLLGGNPVVIFLISMVATSLVSYAATIFLFLPCLFVLSVVRPMTGFKVCMLGLVLGALMFLPMTWMEWKSSGTDSGPPTESFLEFLPRWAADPMTAIYPVAGLLTAGAYWWLGTRQRRSAAAG